MRQRIALVARSVQGIGRAIADTLVASGHVVVGIGIREQDAGSMARTIQADLSDPAAIEELVGDIGAVDILINNAAILVEKPIEDMTIDEFDRTAAANLCAPFLLSRAFKTGMKEHGWGRIVNISSVGARTGAVSQAAAYVATKAGLIALTKNFARSYGPRAVTVSRSHPTCSGCGLPRLPRGIVRGGRVTRRQRRLVHVLTRAAPGPFRRG